MITIITTAMWLILFYKAKDYQEFLEKVHKND